MRLRWTIPASQDLYRIVQRIQRDDLNAAVRVANTLYDGCGSLKTFPFRGREGRIPHTHELVFPGLPYIVAYRIQDQTVDILRIYHGAQDWPRALAFSLPLPAAKIATTSYV